MSSVAEEFVGFPTFTALASDAFVQLVALDFCFNASEADFAFDTVVEFALGGDFALDGLGDGFSSNVIGEGFSIAALGDFALDAFDAVVEFVLVCDFALVGDFALDVLGDGFSFDALGGDFTLCLRRFCLGCL